MKKLLLLIACLFAVSFAQASEPSAACQTDFNKHCSSDKDATDCLLDHQKEVSDACYDSLKQSLSSNSDAGSKSNAGGKAGAGACKKDVQQFCSGVEHGGGRIVKCLKQHENDLSDACYSVLSSKMKSKQ